MGGDCHEPGTISLWSCSRLVAWTARITGLFLLGLVIVIFVGEGGPPNVFRQPPSVQLEFASLALILIGLVVGWVREGFGGFLVLLGLVAFNAVELTVNGRLALGAFPLLALPGVLFLLSARLRRSYKTPPSGN